MLEFFLFGRGAAWHVIEDGGLFDVERTSVFFVDEFVDVLIQVFVGEDEPADSVVRRFRRAVMAAGVIPECRRRRFHETSQDIVKRKQKDSHRRKQRYYVRLSCYVHNLDWPPLSVCVFDDNPGMSHSSFRLNVTLIPVIAFITYYLN